MLSSSREVLDLADLCSDFGFARLRDGDYFDGLLSGIQYVFVNLFHGIGDLWP
jgi:hypothetical protein